MKNKSDEILTIKIFFKKMLVNNVFYFKQKGRRIYEEELMDVQSWLGKVGVINQLLFKLFKNTKIITNNNNQISNLTIIILDDKFVTKFDIS